MYINENDKIKVLGYLDYINNKETPQLFVSFDEYEDYVKLGRNKKERLQILIMCYVNNPTEEELLTWTIDKLLDYIKETDDEEFYEQDMVIVRRCIKLIEEAKE